MATETNNSEGNLVITPEQQQVIFKPLAAFAQGAQKIGLAPAAAGAAVGGFVKKHADTSGIGPRDFYTAGVEGNPIAMMLFEMTSDLMTKTKDAMTDIFNFGGKDEDKPATEGVQEEIKTGVESIDNSLQEDPGAGLEEIEKARESARRKASGRESGKEAAKEKKEKRGFFAKLADNMMTAMGSNLLGTAIFGGITAWLLTDDGRETVKALWNAMPWDAIGETIVDSLPGPEDITEVVEEDPGKTAMATGSATRFAATRGSRLFPGQTLPHTASGRFIRTTAERFAANAIDPSRLEAKRLRDIAKFAKKGGFNLVGPSSVRQPAGAAGGVGGQTVKLPERLTKKGAAAAAETAESGLESAGRHLKKLKAAGWIGKALELGFAAKDILDLSNALDAGIIDQDTFDYLAGLRAMQFIDTAGGAAAGAGLGVGATGAIALPTAGIGALAGPLVVGGFSWAGAEFFEWLGIAQDKWKDAWIEKHGKIPEGVEEFLQLQNAQEERAEEISEEAMKNASGGGGGSMGHTNNIIDASVHKGGDSTAISAPGQLLPMGNGGSGATTDSTVNTGQRP